MVFAHHGVVLDGIEEAVRGMKYTTEGGQNRRVAHMRIDGSTSARARSDLVKVFQSDDDCRVAILSIKAAGVRAVKPQPAHAPIAWFVVAHAGGRPERAHGSSEHQVCGVSRIR